MGGLLFGRVFTLRRFEPFYATVQWTVACRQLDGGNTSICASRRCKRISSSPPCNNPHPFGWGLLHNNIGDSNHSMQQSGGLLLADSSMAATHLSAQSTDVNESPRVHHVTIPTLSGGDCYIIALEIRTILCNSPGDCCLPTARWRQLTYLRKAQMLTNLPASLIPKIPACKLE